MAALIVIVLPTFAAAGVLSYSLTTYRNSKRQALMDQAKEYATDSEMEYLFYSWKSAPALPKVPVANMSSNLVSTLICGTTMSATEISVLLDQKRRESHVECLAADDHPQPDRRNVRRKRAGNCAWDTPDRPQLLFHGRDERVVPRSGRRDDRVPLRAPLRFLQHLAFPVRRVLPGQPGDGRGRQHDDRRPDRDECERVPGIPDGLHPDRHGHGLLFR